MKTHLAFSSFWPLFQGNPFENILKRVDAIAAPWAEGGSLITTTAYVDDGSEFAEEMHSQKIS